MFQIILTKRGLSVPYHKYCTKGALNDISELTPDYTKLRFTLKEHIVRTIPIALTGFPNLTGFLNEFESLIVN